MQLTDQEFQCQFENLTLAESQFDHLGHLRIAFLYLQQNDLPQAIDRVCTGIKRYAANLGAAQKFQHTLTEATVRIMAQRIGLQGRQNFTQFINNNLDLVDNLASVLLDYYFEQTLFSDKARQHYIKPDKRVIAAPG